MTTARGRIVAALQPKLGHATVSRGYALSDGDVQFLAGYLADGVLEVVEELRAEDADLRQRLAALADDLDEQYRTAGEDKPRGSVLRDYARSTALGYRRASLRIRDVLAGYEGSLYYGALPWLRADPQKPVSQQSSEREEQQ